MADDDDFGALYGDAIYTSADAEPEQTTPLPGAGAPEIEGRPPACALSIPRRLLLRPCRGPVR